MSTDPTRPRPNIVFLLADDHAAHAISAYGSRINQTPQLDRLAAGGARCDACFCTNAICAPSRATILTGTHNHVNGVVTMPSPFDASQPTFPALLREAGYQTALFGKWHLGSGPGHDPEGFDAWQVLPGQGDYLDPEFLTPTGSVTHPGYVTDVITDLGLEFLQQRDPDRPFALLLHHKAPHRWWIPAARHENLYADTVFPEPTTFTDDYATRTGAPPAARMRVADHLNARDLKVPVPDGLSAQEAASWKYQRYITDYLRCVAALDENVGRVLDALEVAGLAEDTIVVYSSDQGFFLGDHGWFDKRFSYEASLRMPLLVRYPRTVPAGSVRPELMSNVDFAQTLLDWAGVAAPERMQGVSLRSVLEQSDPTPPREVVYHRYWQHNDPEHGVWAHYALRTDRYKIIFYYNDGLGLPGTGTAPTDEPAWELYDLHADPDELLNRWDDPALAGIQSELVALLARHQAKIGDEPYNSAPRSPHIDGGVVVMPQPQDSLATNAAR